MRILVYTPQFLPSVGGLEYVADAWARQWTIFGHSVTVITQRANDMPDEFSYTVLRNPSSAQIVRQMRSHDVVVMFNVSLKAIPMWRRSGTPLVISHHSSLFIKGNWKQNILQWMKKWVAENWAVCNIACSAYTASSYKKCFVVHSPYKSHVFKNTRQPGREKEVVFAGRLVSDKGCDLLIKAAGILKEQGRRVPTITIIGDGPEKRKLEEQALNCDVSDHIVFAGILPSHELARSLNEHKTMVVPSRMEPFGIVALEGLACGCRMVVSDTGGLPEAAGVFASYFASENAADLADKLQTEMSTPAGIKMEMVNDHLSLFSEEATAKKAIDLISVAVSTRKGRS